MPDTVEQAVARAAHAVPRPHVWVAIGVALLDGPPLSGGAHAAPVVDFDPDDIRLLCFACEQDPDAAALECPGDPA